MLSGYHGHPDHSIVLYEWDFDGDGTHDFSSTGATVTHSYTQFGSQTAVLRVTDDSATAKSDTDTVLIESSSADEPGARVVDGVLLIPGTNTDDHVLVGRLFGTMLVTANFLPGCLSRGLRMYRPSTAWDRRCSIGDGVRKSASVGLWSGSPTHSEASPIFGAPYGG